MTRAGRILLLLLTLATQASAQWEPDRIYKDNIRSVKLTMFGDQLGYPVIGLNSTDQLQLDFDDMEAGVKYYYYRFDLCNADWSPVQMSYMDYVRGFSQVRITTYRQSSMALTRYTHYQAALPNRDAIPTKSGNYILRVFVNGDTAQVAFTRRFLVVEQGLSVAAQVLQPSSTLYFRTHHRLQVQVGTQAVDIRYPQQQVRLTILQNYRWDNRLDNIPPTFVRPDRLQFDNEQQMLFPAGREWRWANLRSFRLLGDRVAKQENTDKSFTLYMKEEAPRSPSSYAYFRDNNGRYLIETTENINPYWESDYADVHFRFATPDGKPYPGKELYVFGEITDYGRDPHSRMVYNTETGLYEATLRLKQGYYDYGYALKAPSEEAFSMDPTEGNFWEAEATYMILVYYRELGGRYDQLMGITRVNSITNRPGFQP
jgi:hypothetical protein